MRNRREYANKIIAEIGIYRCRHQLKSPLDMAQMAKSPLETK